MEISLFIIRKNGTRFGTLEGVITAAHGHFYSFVPASSPLESGHENVDGTLRFTRTGGLRRAMTAQEAKGHGLKAFPIGVKFHKRSNDDGIIYYPPSTAGEVPSSGNDRNVKYRLESLFETGGLWSRQLQQLHANTRTLAKWGTLRGNEKGTCGKGATVTCISDAAKTPWGSDDEDDGPLVSPIPTNRVAAGEGRGPVAGGFSAGE